MASHQVILGLGANWGDRSRYLQRAVDSIRTILSAIQCSCVYQNKALLPEGAPAEWDKPFLNMAVCGNTTLKPRELLGEIKSIERAIGRVFRGQWGPREIDIDILVYGDYSVNEDDLTIPHRGLLQRDFALVPLADLVPQWTWPLRDTHYGMTAFELAGRVSAQLTRTDIIIQ